MNKCLFILFTAIMIVIVSYCGAIASEAQALKVLTLDECVSIAAKNNPVLAKWQMDIKSAESAVKSAQAEFRPNVSMLVRNGYGTEMDTNVIVLGAGFNQFSQEAKDSTSAKLRVQQTLFDYGKTRYVVDANKENLNAQNIGYRNELTLVFFQVKEAYYRSLLQAKLIKLYSQSIERNEKLRNMAKTRVEVGDAITRDVLRAEVNLKNAISQKVTAEMAYRTSLAELAKIMGVSERNFFTTGELQDINWHGDTSIYFERIYKLAIENRHDIKQIVAKRKNQELLASAAALNDTPNLLLVGDRSYDSQSQNRNTWLVALELNCQLYDGGRAKAHADEYRRKAQGLAEEERGVKLKIGADINMLLNEIASYKTVLENNLASLEQAKENLRIVETSYQYGDGSLMDYTDALNLIDTATAAVLQTKFNILLAYINLEREAGCPLEPENFGEKEIYLR